ncbi:hypothetical protein HYPSUDRAFT_165972 [Hypholoma sublateritium FD-334 SS-4]|uniref:Nucleoside diphosphate kinase n=1 Tax=Hypholoma sublateritium (strain FD-334 SS-4) TaxID=945553 RepID=A0A0D2MCL4_HYPSF|nr:hypothetical protein HYPSUDRAFT_165972 [Hypholoma sublateritium FD-334 SS-4]
MSASPSYSPERQPNEFPESEDNTVILQPMVSAVSSTSPITRTVAIIKTHALQHRFDIEKRIQEASFEIVKERQMEFDTETDPDTLYELFGEDADSLAEGPVWVYVLERRRAVEVWNALMGERDAKIARQDSPNSLRALYGLSYQQNGLMGAPDMQTAEVQIASLFASSPPFPTTELPLTDDKYDSLQEVSASLLESIRRAAADDEGYAPSSVTNPSTLNGGSTTRLNANGKPAFKARPMPATHDKPTIVPRTTKAAALRAGQPIEKAQNTPRTPVTKERHAETFANVPGHKRTSTISVASTAAPTIAPRMTRAASLRLGQTPAPVPLRSRSLTAEGQANTFEGVPGHKRRESIAVASSKAPTVAPRLNKSAALRQQKDSQAPPTSFMFRSANAEKIHTLSRSTSATSLSAPKSVVSRPPSQASVNATPSRYAVGKRASSVIGQNALPRPGNANHPNPTLKPATSRATPELTPAAKPAPRPSSVAASATKLRPRPSVGAPPSIAPRTNKAAALRVAKKEEENAAAAAARKAPRSSKAAPPTSFKAVAT